MMGVGPAYAAGTAAAAPHAPGRRGYTSRRVPLALALVGVVALSFALTVWTHRSLGASPSQQPSAPPVQSDKVALVSSAPLPPSGGVSRVLGEYALDRGGIWRQASPGSSPGAHALWYHPALAAFLVTTIAHVGMPNASVILRLPAPAADATPLESIPQDWSEWIGSPDDGSWVDAPRVSVIGDRFEGVRAGAIFNEYGQPLAVAHVPCKDGEYVLGSCSPAPCPYWDPLAKRGTRRRGNPTGRVLLAIDAMDIDDTTRVDDCAARELAAWEHFQHRLEPGFLGRVVVNPGGRHARLRWFKKAPDSHANGLTSVVFKDGSFGRLSVRDMPSFAEVSTSEYERAPVEGVAGAFAHEWIEQHAGEQHAGDVMSDSSSSSGDGEVQDMAAASDGGVAMDADGDVAMAEVAWSDVDARIIAGVAATTDSKIPWKKIGESAGLGSDGTATMLYFADNIFLRLFKAEPTHDAIAKTEHSVHCSALKAKAALHAAHAAEAAQATAVVVAQARRCTPSRVSSRAVTALAWQATLTAAATEGATAAVKAIGSMDDALLVLIPAGPVVEALRAAGATSDALGKQASTLSGAAA
jgi:hypothetical protein